MQALRLRGEAHPLVSVNVPIEGAKQQRGDQGAHDDAHEEELVAQLDAQLTVREPPKLRKQVQLVAPIPATPSQPRGLRVVKHQET